MKISPQMLILLLWLLLTALNLNKAVHIDDTFHLLAAEQILEEPSNPMSGLVNWGTEPRPLHEFNQPPFFFYLMAAVMYFCGTNVVALHLLVSVFTFFALVFFHRITVLFELPKRKTLLLFFGLSPALIVNQNIMVDIPLLSMILGAVYYLMKGIRSEGISHFIFAALLLAMAVMTKYSSIPVILAALLFLLFQKRFKGLLIMSLPIWVLVLWSAWNQMEYGGVHLLDRPTREFDSMVIWSFLSALGAMSPFLITLLAGEWGLSRKHLIVYVSLLLVTPVLYFSGFIEKTTSDMMLDILFLIHGILLLAVVSNRLWRFENVKAFLSSERLIFFLIAGGLSAFMVLFAPFIASRHILLILPFLLILSAGLLAKSSRSVGAIGLSLVAFLGIGLGISDRAYADYYRSVELNSKAGLDLESAWTIGHWGWQWYAQDKGLKIYNGSGEDLKDGDLLVYPGNVSMQGMPNELSLEIKERIWQDAPFITSLSSKDFASMYNSFYGRPAWNYSKDPSDTVFVADVLRGERHIIHKIYRDSTWFEQVRAMAVEKQISIDSMMVLSAQWVLKQKEKEEN